MIDPIGPLPAGVNAPATAAEKELFKACQSMEGVFTQTLLKEMLKSARGSEDQGINSIYQDMTDTTMTEALTNSGAFGLAGTLYGQLQPLVAADAAGAAIPATADAADPATAAGAALPSV